MTHGETVRVESSEVAIQRMLSDWAHFQESPMLQREQHEYDVKKKIRNLSLAYPNN